MGGPGRKKKKREGGGWGGNPKILGNPRVSVGDGLVGLVGPFWAALPHTKT